MRITNEQQRKLDRLRCLRVKDAPTDILNEIKGPKVNGQDATLVDLFRNPNYLQEDVDGALASYVIVSPQNQVLVFFSIRCGELFFKSDPHKMVLGHNAWVAINMLMNKALAEDDRKKALDAIRAARDAGIAFEDFEFYADKKQSFINDVKKEPSTEASRVSQVFPAVELKFFGVNANASDYCRFLYQDISKLVKEKERFFNAFNTEVEDPV